MKFPFFRKKHASLAMTIMLVAGSISIASSGLASAASSYDAAVLADQPVGYWPLAPGVTTDSSGNGLNGSFTGSPTTETMPNGDAAPGFNGIDQYFTIPDHDLLEVTNTGILTVEAWMRPDVLEFPKSESSGYVHWMGKGEPGQHSWVARMYSFTNTENRPNRISGYSFNMSGGLGAGSYFQDAVTPGEWIHYTLTINTVDVSSSYPTGYTKIFKNGVLRDQDSLLGYNIIPGDGTAPMRIGTRNLVSFFQGAIGKVAVYDYELTSAQLNQHVNEMHTANIENTLQKIHETAAIESVTNDELDRTVDLYRDAEQKLGALPAYLDKAALKEQLAAAEESLFNAIKAYMASPQPGNKDRASERLLDFVIAHAIAELDAQSPGDAGSVQGYVMSIVRSHATGQHVKQLIVKQLAN
ncbi:Uncharacterized conserved protein YqeY [Paenibacillus sp. UNCCL117]|uniref:LamG domain-containing protein n=1 Tax=unclassified Paenibacillus TaxID=185978 RepID=UPI000892751F|nr:MULTISPECIES: LamG domain-containing protein [unclassified Paenibacillus]SDE65862.1 Uncharacterized conserved protein YqeY [Paenibacillus sp. cl123]SFW70366.1 Uncharacterized conserved protein YqeY [Paenibacillus sp. UNCCL117]